MKHRLPKQRRPCILPAPYDEEAVDLALHSGATVDQAEALMAITGGDHEVAVYACRLIGKGWSYADTRAVALWLVATGRRPPAEPRKQAPGALVVRLTAQNKAGEVGALAALGRWATDNWLNLAVALAAVAVLWGLANTR